MLKLLVFLVIVGATKGESQKPDSLFLSPTRAAFLSAIIPGGGQFYTHSPIKGVLFGVGEVVFLGKTLLDFKDLNKESDPTKREPLLRQTMGDLFWFIGFWGFSIIDAYITASFWKFREKNLEIYSKVKGWEFREVGMGLLIRF